MAIIRIGVDLAKNVFALHGVDETGRVQLARMVRREQLLEILAAVPPVRGGDGSLFGCP
jgi:transposase